MIPVSSEHNNPAAGKPDAYIWTVLYWRALRANSVTEKCKVNKIQTKSFFSLLSAIFSMYQENYSGVFQIILPSLYTKYLFRPNWYITKHKHKLS